MKIGLVCPYGINKHGGVQEVVLALKKGLEARGHTVRILTPRPRGTEETDVPEDTIYVGVSVDFRTLSFSDTTSQVSSTADNEKIDAMLAEEQFDILNFHEPWMPLISRQLLQRSTSVNIGTFHARVSEAMMSRAIIRLVAPYLRSVLSYIHELTAVSPTAAEYAQGMTDQHITYIPNGIDLTKYTYAQTHKQEHKRQKTILFIGRLERRKGAQYLLRAYAELIKTQPHVKLVIAGDGPERERLELLAEDLKLRDVSFEGFVSEQRKLQLLTRADLFCSPALFGESFGIVLLEAMATNTVTVAGNNSGYIDVMDGLGGVSIVNPKDYEEFARRLKLLLYEEHLRALWQSWANEYVQQFNYPDVVARYEAFYVEALKRHGKRH